MFTARGSEAAERDLRDIAFHIALIDRRPLIADRIIDELIEQANTLAPTVEVNGNGHRLSGNRGGRADILVQAMGYPVSLRITRSRCPPIRGFEAGLRVVETLRAECSQA